MRNLWENERWTAVLKETATTLRSVVRPTDTIARFDQEPVDAVLDDVFSAGLPRADDGRPTGERFEINQAETLKRRPHNSKRE